jgi:hypothetical protein
MGYRLAQAAALVALVLVLATMQERDERVAQLDAREVAR